MSRELSADSPAAALERSESRKGRSTYFFRRAYAGDVGPGLGRDVGLAMLVMLMPGGTMEIFWFSTMAGLILKSRLSRQPRFVQSYCGEFRLIPGVKTP